jgi:hypothetical protein
MFSEVRSYRLDVDEVSRNWQRIVVGRDVSENRQHHAHEDGDENEECSEEASYASVLPDELENSMLKENKLLMWVSAFSDKTSNDENFETFENVFYFIPLQTMKSSQG